MISLIMKGVKPIMNMIPHFLSFDSFGFLKPIINSKHPRSMNKVKIPAILISVISFKVVVQIF